MSRQRPLDAHSQFTQERELASLLIMDGYEIAGIELLRGAGRRGRDVFEFELVLPEEDWRIYQETFNHGETTLNLSKFAGACRRLAALIHLARESGRYVSPAFMGSANYDAWKEE